MACQQVEEFPMSTEFIRTRPSFRLAVSGGTRVDQIRVCIPNRQVENSHALLVTGIFMNRQGPTISQPAGLCLSRFTDDLLDSMVAIQFRSTWNTECVPGWLFSLARFDGRREP